MPAFPALTDEDVFNDPHMWERNVWVHIDHPIAGRKAGYGRIWKLSGTPSTMERPCPAMGQDNDFVFQGLLGMPPAEQHALAEAQVVY